MFPTGLTPLLAGTNGPQGRAQEHTPREAASRPCYSERVMSSDSRGVPLSTNLDDPAAIPYFTWDEPLTVAEVKRRLREASPAESARLLGKILREARDTDVWKFTTPDEVHRRWDEIHKHLGRSRPFWTYLFGRWQAMGLLAG